MERRSYATFRKVWPEKEVLVTSPQLSLAEYLNRYSHGALTPDDVVSIMVGDLQRIRVYAEIACGRRIWNWSKQGTTGTL